MRARAKAIPATWKPWVVSLGLLFGWVTVATASPYRNDLEPTPGYAAWGKTLANPRIPTDVRRMTRTFEEVLKPKQHFFAPKSEGVVYFPRTHRWQDFGSPVTGPRVIGNKPEFRTLWLRWDLWKIPRQAVIQKAELRMKTRAGDGIAEASWPSKVGLALQTVTPDRITMRWNRNLRGPLAPSHIDVRSRYWNVTRFAQVAHQTGELWRNFGLAIDNAGHLIQRQPELVLWYTLPVTATAE